jgi:hypothetical protein
LHRQCLAYLGAHFRDVVEAPRHKSDVAVAEKLLQDHVLIHLDKPAEKYNCLIFMVRGVAPALPCLATGIHRCEVYRAARTTRKFGR